MTNSFTKTCLVSNVSLGQGKAKGQVLFILRGEKKPAMFHINFIKKSELASLINADNTINYDKMPEVLDITFDECVKGQPVLDRDGKAVLDDKGVARVFSETWNKATSFNIERNRSTIKQIVKQTLVATAE
jgi:hypothetical protein